MGWFAQFASDEEGATMVEYGLMLGLLAVVSISVVTSLGFNLRSKFSTIAQSAW